MVEAIKMSEENKINLNRFPHDSYQYFPSFEGSTGGWLRSAESEEKYVITWTSQSDNYFEMPIGGSAKLNVGLNLFYFSRKEQCLALGKQLRSEFKINDYKIFRLIPGGEIQFLHPKDSVFPEKVNQGRVSVGKREFSIGLNPNPSSVKFTGKTTYDTESKDSVKFLSLTYATFAYRLEKVLQKKLIEESIIINQIESKLNKENVLSEDEIIYYYIDKILLNKKIDSGYFISDLLKDNEIAPYLNSFELFVFSNYFDDIQKVSKMVENCEQSSVSLSPSEVLPENIQVFVSKIIETETKDFVPNSKKYYPRYYKNLYFYNSASNLVKDDSPTLPKIPFSKIWTFSQYIFCFSPRLSASLYNMDLNDYRTFSSIFFKRLLIIFLYCQSYGQLYGVEINLIKMKKL